MTAKAITEVTIYHCTCISSIYVDIKLKCEFEGVCYENVFMTVVSLSMSRIGDDKSHSHLHISGAGWKGTLLPELLPHRAGCDGSVLSHSLGKVRLLSNSKLSTIVFLCRV